MRGFAALAYDTWLRISTKVHPRQKDKKIAHLSSSLVATINMSKIVLTGGLQGWAVVFWDAFEAC